MTEEHELVPYHVSPLPPGPWLVFAPHGDDETFGMGGALLLASAKGIKIKIVVLTDGSLGGEPGSQGLIERREAEVKQVAGILGNCETDFWRQRDRGLFVNPELIDRISRLISDFRPASIFFPSILEFHPDHRATAKLVWEGQRVSSFSGICYSYEITVQSPINLLIDISSVFDEKLRLINCYQSQLEQGNYMALASSMDKLRCFSLPGEISYAEGFYAFPCHSGHDLSYYISAHFKRYWQEENYNSNYDRLHFNSIGRRLSATFQKILIRFKGLSPFRKFLGSVHK